MNTIINKISTPTYQKINFQSRNNQQKTERNNNSTRNILVSSLIALASLSVPTVEANAHTNIDKIEIIFCIRGYSFFENYYTNNRNYSDDNPKRS